MWRMYANMAMHSMRPALGNTVELDLLAAGLAISALGLGYVGWRGSAGARARRKLTRLSPLELHNARNATSMALYAEGFDGSRLPDMPDTLTHETTLTDLRNPHLHGDHIQSNLRAARRGADSAKDKAAIGKAAYVLRLVQRGGLANHLLDPADPSGILK